MEKLWNGWQGLVALISIILIPEFIAAQFTEVGDLWAFIL